MLSVDESFYVVFGAVLNDLLVVMHIKSSNLLMGISMIIFASVILGSFSATYLSEVVVFGEVSFEGGASKNFTKYSEIVQKVGTQSVLVTLSQNSLQETKSVVAYNPYQLKTQSGICNFVEVDFQNLGEVLEYPLTATFSTSNNKTFNCQLKNQPKESRKLSATYRLQYGRITAGGTDNLEQGIPTKIYFEEPFSDPVVVAMVASNNDDDSVTCRMDKLDSKGFDLF